MKLFRKILSAAILAGITTSANAAISLNIFEDINGKVVFDFSGSSTVQANNGYYRNGFWFGDIVNQLYSGTSGGYSNWDSNSFSASNETQNTSSLLSDVYLNGGAGHELGIRLDDFSILTNSNAGDVISWSGQTVFSSLNFASFTTGTWSGNSLNAGGSDNITLSDGGYIITIGEHVAAVPEPSTYALMLGGLGLVGFMAARRRKQA